VCRVHLLSQAMRTVVVTPGGLAGVVGVEGDGLRALPDGVVGLAVDGAFRRAPRGAPGRRRSRRWGRRRGVGAGAPRSRWKKPAMAKKCVARGPEQRGAFTDHRRLGDVEVESLGGGLQKR